MDKIYLSINLYNAIAQYLDTCPASGVRNILNALEQEIVPQVKAAQEAQEAEEAKKAADEAAKKAEPINPAE